MESRRPAKPDGEGPRDAGRHPRRRAPDRRRGEHQHHAPVRHRRLRAGGGGLSEGPGGAEGQGRRLVQGGQRGQLLREPHRHGRGQTARRGKGQGGGVEAPRQGGDRQCQGRLCALSGPVFGPALAGAGGRRRPDPAPPLGVDLDQGPGLQGHALCRIADRTRHGGHHSAGHHGRVPRPRRGRSRHHRAGCSRRTSYVEGDIGRRRLPGADHPRPGHRRRSAVRRRLRRAVRFHRQKP